MSAALRLLLAEAIDYAGPFPPASLSVSDAAHKFAEYRTWPEAWLLGWLVCPAARVDELCSWIAAGQQDVTVSMVLSSPDRRGDRSRPWGRELNCLTALPWCLHVDALEVRCPLEDALEPGAAEDWLSDLAAAVTASGLSAKDVFVELDMAGGPSASVKGKGAAALVDALAKWNRLKPPFRIGYKIRMGGADAGAIPSPREAAQILCACRDAGICWKATAGLHHALRHFDYQMTAPAHGFLNLFVAAVLADAHHLSPEEVERILRDESAAAFGFESDAIRWRDYSASLEQIQSARQRGLVSFGSCSFDEPVGDLRALDLL